MYLYTLFNHILIFTAAMLLTLPSSYAFVAKDGDRILIIDRYGEKWDITQAATIGFKPHRFQYGIGRYAFTPLNDNHLADNQAKVSQNLRVIGVTDGQEAQAYSVPKLSGHEIANTTIGSKPIAAGY